MGSLQFASFAAVSQYFEQKRAPAPGIVVSGSSIGVIIIPIVISKMLNSTNLGLPGRSGKLWITEAYKSARFKLFVVARFFTFLGMFTPMYFIPTYAISRGMGATLAGYLLVILNATSTFGRIIPGVLADKYGQLNMFAFGGIMTGITICCMNFAVSNTDIMIYAGFFGFVSGTIISGASATL